MFPLRALATAPNNTSSRMTKRNFAKPFSIAGFVLGVIYNFAIVFGRSPSGEIVPFAYLVQKFLVLSIFCGVFGALIGLGIGLLVSALLPKR
jgi:uncharacterized membrane protein